MSHVNHRRRNPVAKFMNQKELDETMDQMFLSYIEELDDARLNRELELFNKELEEMRNG